MHAVIRYISATPQTLVSPPVPAFGQKIASYDTGRGPVLVLVHGFTSQVRFAWSNLVEPIGMYPNLDQ